MRPPGQAVVSGLTRPTIEPRVRLRRVDDGAVRGAIDSVPFVVGARLVVVSLAAVFWAVVVAAVFFAAV